jgi:tetratricopeptide (TPR) repeat protein
MIIPVSQLKPIGETIASDRYFYLSSIGLFFILGYLIDYMFEKVQIINRQQLLIPFYIFGLICFYFAYQRTKDWKNTETLWQSVINVNPELDKGYYGVGYVYYSENNYVKAKEYFYKALEKNSFNEKANNNLGNIYYNSANYDSAFYYYSKVIESNPEFSQGYYNLGNIYFIKNQLDKALEFYKKALALEPENQMYLSQYNETLKVMNFE